MSRYFDDLPPDKAWRADRLLNERCQRAERRRGTVSQQVFARLIGVTRRDVNRSPEEWSEWGLLNWHRAGARAMHRKLLEQGRTPGDEGRAVIQARRIARKLKPFTDMGWRMPSL